MNFESALDESKTENVVDAQYEVAPAAPLSLDTVKPKFADYVKAAEAIELQAKAVKVDSDATLQDAVSIGGKSKKALKDIELQRKQIISEPKGFVDSVNGYCKMITGKLAEAEETLKQKINTYKYQQELERRKAEEAARKAAQELQARLDREAAEANRKAREEAARLAEEEARKRTASQAEIDAARKKAEAEVKEREIQAPVVPAPIVPKAENITRTESGSSYQRKVWTAEIEDESQVPREYLMVDTKKINDSVRMGVRSILGVKIYEKTSTSFRG